MRYEEISKPAFGFVLLFAALVLPHNQRPGKGFLAVRGSQVVDESGTPVQLRGFNAGLDLAGYREFSKFYSQEQLKRKNKVILDHYFGDYDYEHMQNMGVNVIRASLPQWRLLEYAPYQYDDKYIDLIEEKVNQAYGHGIRTILVMNDAGESSIYYQTDVKEGHPLILWKDPERRAQVYATWEHLAARFADNPGVAGYDLMNEPQPPSKAALHDFYQNCIDAIRKHDPRHIIFMDTKHFPIDLNIAWGGTYTDPNIVLETHHYSKNLFQANRNDPHFQFETRRQIQDGLNQLLNHPDRGDRPIYIGEFGVYMEDGQKGFNWVKNMIDVMNNNGVHWTYFSYKCTLCPQTVHNPGCLSIHTLSLYYPSEPLFIHPTKEQLAKYLKNGLPTPTHTQLESLRTEHFMTNATLQAILTDGFTSPATEPYSKEGRL